MVEYVYLLILLLSLFCVYNITPVRLTLILDLENQIGFSHLSLRTYETSLMILVL